MNRSTSPGRIASPVAARKLTSLPILMLGLAAVFATACVGGHPPGGASTDGGGAIGVDDGGVSGDAGEQVTDGGDPSTDGGVPTSSGTVVGAAGGTVTADGVTLVVPAGALSEDTTISITTTTATMPDGVDAVSEAFQFLPAGLTFQTPASVKFTVSAAVAGAQVYWSKAGGAPGFDALTTVPLADGTSYLAPVTHFSVGFLGAPASASGSCSAGEDAQAQFEATTTPLGTVLPLGSQITLGGSGAAYLTSYTGSGYNDGSGHPGTAYAARDGHTFRPIAFLAPFPDFTSTVTLEGRMAVDAANDFVYAFVKDAGDLVLERQGPTGCIETVHRFTGVFTAWVLAVGPTGDLLVSVEPGGSNRNCTLWIGRSEGASWTQGAASYGYCFVTSAAFAPTDANRLYLGVGSGNSTWPESLYGSADGGATFVGGNTPPLTQSPNFGTVSSVVVSPTDPKVAYASTSSGPYGTTDGGATWTQAFGDIPTAPSWMQWTSDGRLFVAGHAASFVNRPPVTDDGLMVRDAAGSWSSLDGDLTGTDRQVSVFSVKTGAGGDELVRLGKNLWHSTDGGAHWTSTFAGAAGETVTRPLTSATDANTFYALTDPSDGLWRTSDGGATFIHVLAGEDASHAMLLGDGTLVLAQSNLQGETGVRSVDDGATVLPMTSSDPTYFVPGTMLVDADPHAGYVRTAPNLWRTLDSGATWQLATSPDVPGAQQGPQQTDALVVADPKFAHRLVSIDHDATGLVLVVSTDAGSTWAPAALPITGWSPGDAFTLVFDASGTLYVAARDAQGQMQLYAEASGATSWSQRSVSPFGAMGLSAIGDDLRTSPFLSTDGGATWNAVMPNTVPWMADLNAVSPRADPTSVLFQLEGLRRASL